MLNVIKTVKGKPAERQGRKARSLKQVFIRLSRLSGCHIFHYAFYPIKRK